jgi:DNA-directed RNA polymerase subunit beta'
LIERGIVKTVKSAKKLVDKKEAVVWDILENVMKGHPVLLNRAPTLHRLSIQAFQPKLVEGKAIQLHPLVTTAFNADFDGDQMAVHVPLSNASVLEAQLLMLSAHNILNPQNGTPVTIPSQDMILGLYYITKAKSSVGKDKVAGEGSKFYSAEEAIIAYNENKVDLHANVKCRVRVRENGELRYKLLDTTLGRIIFNENVPASIGYVNELLSKKNLKNIIGEVLALTDMPTTVKFLDDIKELGFKWAFKGGLSFNIDDLIVPEVKNNLLDDAQSEVDGIWDNYNMGLITNNERYNKIIDTWTRVDHKITDTLMTEISKDKQGFNSVYMMLDSGARGSKSQIKQLAGIRGLMAKPRKSGSSGGEIIENPILANFKDGLTVLDYFISTHGARKGLADTALKTADAGYLTRRLVDVAQDVVITSEDCGTLRGIPTSALKDNEDIVEPLYDRIIGRTSLLDVINPLTGELLVSEGQLINEVIAAKIEDSPVEIVEIRSVLTCENRRGVCSKCYGRNLASNRPAQLGDAVGIIAAQSIGEPGTQLTLRTFHTGGIASGAASDSKMLAKFDGKVELEGEKFANYKSEDGEVKKIVISRTCEVRLLSPETGNVVISNHIPYGSQLMVKNGANIKKGDVICTWDPFNAVIITEYSGKVKFDSVIDGITYREELDEQTGHRQKVTIESKDKRKLPSIIIVDDSGKDIYSYSLPVGAHIEVEDNAVVTAGQILVKIPRTLSKLRDITGGLPRVTELFEARNPSNPAKVSEIDGVVSFGKVKRGNREISIAGKDGSLRKYLVPLTKNILVQDGDFVKAGMPLSDGSITPSDILNIKGPSALQEYLVNEVQEVYRLQGVKINDKHIEVIVRQMMRDLFIDDPGDTRFLEKTSVDKFEFIEQNDWIYDKKVITDAGESENLTAGMLVSLRQIREENSFLKRNDRKPVAYRDAIAATASPMLLGITRSSLSTNSWISAASFQETTKVLSTAAINASKDFMVGLKENVIVGHRIPAGTGVRKYEDMVVSSKKEFESLSGRNAISDED